LTAARFGPTAGFDDIGTRHAFARGGRRGAPHFIRGGRGARGGQLNKTPDHPFLRLRRPGRLGSVPRDPTPPGPDTFRQRRLTRQASDAHFPTLDRSRRFEIDADATTSGPNTFIRGARGARGGSDSPGRRFTRQLTRRFISILRQRRRGSKTASAEVPPKSIIEACGFRFLVHSVRSR
jgi:hypothetical protein